MARLRLMIIEWWPCQMKSFIRNSAVEGALVLVKRDAHERVFEIKD
jgi:hypothetical protein